jgi:hypothetical protein
MHNALRLLADLHDRLARGAEEGMPADTVNRLCVTPVADELHIDYYGTPFDEPLQDVLAAVITSDVSAVLASLTLRGPDEGANGTRNWDLSILAESDVVFPKLREVSIEQTKPADHNRPVVAADYDEEGVLGRLLAQAPALESLVTPSAPNASFFQAGQRPLKYLNVDAGYDTQGFIGNLARSSCFRGLRCVEFGEYNETYMEDYAGQCTPISDYQELFSSESFKQVRRFVWRNPVCSAAEIASLKALRPDLQLLIVRTSAEYLQ